MRCNALTSEFLNISLKVSEIFLLIHPLSGDLELLKKIQIDLR